MQKEVSTEKKIENYLHLYLGCECISVDKKPGTKKYILSAITTDGLCEFKTIPEKFSTVLYNWKPILRPLSDMTEEEAMDIAKLDFKVEHNMVYKLECTGRIASYLFSKHFDLFGLIESGLAIDKTKL